jgi:hypothetical protein
VKRRDLERHLREHGARPVGGSKHEKWRGPTGRASVVPRHNEIAWPLARKVCRDPQIPAPAGAR